MKITMKDLKKMIKEAVLVKEVTVGQSSELDEKVSAVFTSVANNIENDSSIEDYIFNVERDDYNHTLHVDLMDGGRITIRFDVDPLYNQDED